MGRCEGCKRGRDTDMIREKLWFQEPISTAMDILTIFVSYVFAVYIRYEVMESKPGIDTLSAPYLLIALAYGAIIASLLGYVRRTRGTGKGSGLGYGLFAINAVGCLFLLAFLYTIGELYFSRWALVLFWLISSALLILKDMALTAAFTRKQRHLSREKRVVVIGSGRNCGDYIRAVGFDAACDFSIVGYVGERSHTFFDCRFEQSGDEQEDEDAGWLGGYTDAETILERRAPDEVVFALEGGEMDVLDRLQPIVRKLGIKASMVPDFGRHIPANAVMRNIDGMKVIDLCEGQEKRESGIFGLGLTLSSVFLILMLVIKRFSIGNMGRFYLYEAYRCFIFAMAGSFLFFNVRKALEGKRFGSTAAALIAILAGTAAIFLYEAAYTRGEGFSRDIGYDLKMTLAAIAACWAMKAAVDHIAKDDHLIMM